MSVAILKIKNEQGHWVEIPAITGKDGKQGVSIDTIILKKRVGHVDTYGIELTDGREYEFELTHGNIITNVALISTDVLIDTYRISLDDNTYHDFQIKNGRGIANISKTGTDILDDTYTITYNDNTTSTYHVMNGRGIVRIEKSSTDILTDTYTIYYNDETTSTYTIKNGRGINYIEKDETIGLTDRYTIHYNDGTTSSYHVVNGESGPSGSIGNRIYDSGVVKKANDEEGYEKVLQLKNNHGVSRLFVAKNDDYSIGGSPVITADGMFKHTGIDYIYKTLSLTPTNSIRLVGRHYWSDEPNDNGSVQILARLAFGDNAINCAVRKDAIQQDIRIYNGTSNALQVVEIPLKDNDIIDYELTVNATEILLKVILNENVTYTVTHTSPGLGQVTQITIGDDSDTIYYWTGYIDLNSIRLYIDEILRWQPCLKWNYIQCQTGAKIADGSVYHRIKDYYEQTGKGIFYTLDETNLTYSLPIPDIYGSLVTLEDTKVNRAGDVMTGPLEISPPSYTHPLLKLKNPSISSYDAPTDNKYEGIIFEGDINEWVAYIQHTHHTNGNSQLDFGARNKMADETLLTSSLSIIVDKSGNKYVTVPTPPSNTDNSTKVATTNWVREHRCTTQATTSSTASVDAPCYVVQNYVNGTSWYRIWSDGWKECGAWHSLLASDTNANLAIAFSNTNYNIVMCFTGTVAREKAGVVTKVSNAVFKVTHSAGLNNGFGIVYYACGY